MKTRSGICKILKCSWLVKMNLFFEENFIQTNGEVKSISTNRYKNMKIELNQRSLNQFDILVMSLFVLIRLRL